MAGFATLAVTAGARPLWPVFVAASLGITALIVFLAASTRPSTREVLFFGVVFRLLMLPVLPGLSDDAFRYLWDGMLQWEGINPFLHRPGDPALAHLQDNPIYSGLSELSTANHTAYPPLSQIVFLASGWIPAQAWPTAHLLMKVLVVGCEVGVLFLLARMAPPAALILYAWNPLVIVETAGQVHTEAIMVSLLIVCIWAYRVGRSNLAVASLTGAVWVKLYPVLFLPFLLRRVGWRRTWIIVLVSAVLVAPYFRPEAAANIASSLALYVSLFEFYSGPYLMLKWIAYAIGGTHGLETVLGVGLFIAFVAYVGWLVVEDDRRPWSLAKVFLLVLAGYYITATTIHPWYFLGLLVLVPVVPMPNIQRFAWIWLAGFSTATYLVYSHGWYWPFVWLGWGVWLILMFASTDRGRSSRSTPLRWLLKRRARRKVSIIRPHLEAGTEEFDRQLAVLDLGAGEGYVGKILQESGHYAVTLCDIRDSNDTDLPFVVYDGRELPFGDDWFDTTILVYTLHHCEDHVAVLREAGRVTSQRLVILESVFQTEADRRLLAWLDRTANRIRSGGGMAEEAHFRKFEDWIGLLEAMGFEIESARKWGRMHKQGLIVAE